MWSRWRWCVAAVRARSFSPSRNVAVLRSCPSSVYSLETTAGSGRAAGLLGRHSEAERWSQAFFGMRSGIGHFAQNLELFLASALGKDLGAQLSAGCGRGGELQEGKGKDLCACLRRGCTLLKMAIFWAESQQDWIFPGPVGTRVAHTWRGSSCEGGGPSCGCWGPQTQRLQHAKSTAFGTAFSTALPSDLPRPNLAG